MSDSEFAQYAFGGQGGQGGTKFPLQATGSRERIVSRRLTKDLLALTGAFEKLLGLMEEKLGAKATFFLRNLSQLRSKTPVQFFRLDTCVGQEKIQAEKFESWLGFQSVR